MFVLLVITRLLLMVTLNVLLALLVAFVSQVTSIHALLATLRNSQLKITVLLVLMVTCHMKDTAIALHVLEAPGLPITQLHVSSVSVVSIVQRIKARLSKTLVLLVSFH